MGSTNEPGDHSETSPETAERGVFPYRTAASFRTALKDRLTAIANGDDRYTVNELQRQFAYDRSLARLFTAEDAERWVLKGAGDTPPRQPMRGGLFRTSTRRLNSSRRC